MLSLFLVTGILVMGFGGTALMIIIESKLMNKAIARALSCENDPVAPVPPKDSGT